ncbi:MAG: hypothetical protein ABI488_07270 [Polyangiaceae bacterium]
MGAPPSPLDLKPFSAANEGGARSAPRPSLRAHHKLQRAGIRIVRVSAKLVLTDLAAAVALIRAAI